MAEMDQSELSYIAEDLRALAVDIDLPVLDPANSREGHDVEGIAAAIALYGQRTPIVINVSQGNKVEKGNGTLKAMRSLGKLMIAAVKVQDDPMTATGYAIADNRLGDKSRFNYEVLARLFDEMEAPTQVPGVDDVFLAEVLAAGTPFDPDSVEFKEYDESIVDEVEWIECPECGHRWPK